jgi:hypothetical protein
MALSEDEKMEIGWQSPTPAAREEERLMEKERRIKSNNDRTYKVRNAGVRIHCPYVWFW